MVVVMIMMIMMKMTNKMIMMIMMACFFCTISSDQPVEWSNGQLQRLAHVWHAFSARFRVISRWGGPMDHSSGWRMYGMLFLHHFK
jgi:hypothetical protein